MYLMLQMDFSAMEKTVYGNRNLEDDPELMAELLALEEEERQRFCVFVYTSGMIVL